MQEEFKTIDWQPESKKTPAIRLKIQGTYKTVIPHYYFCLKVGGQRYELYEFRDTEAIFGPINAPTLILCGPNGNALVGLFNIDTTQSLEDLARDPRIIYLVSHLS